jgi:hypothetical protein
VIVSDIAAVVAASYRERAALLRSQAEAHDRQEEHALASECRRVAVLLDEAARAEEVEKERRAR